MVLWGVRGVYKLIVGLKGENVVRSTKCGDARLKTHGKSEIEVVHVGERVQIAPCVGSALRRCGGSQIHVTSRNYEYEG